MRRNRLPRLIALACILSSHGQYAVALPDIVAGHPRLYATPADLDRLKRAIPVWQVLPDRGKITLTIKPAAKVDGDNINATLFGRNSTTQNNILIRHIDSEDTGTHAAILIALTAANSTTSPPAYAKVNVQFNTEIKLTLDYDGAISLAKYTINGGASQDMIRTPGLTGWKLGHCDERRLCLLNGLDMNGRTGDSARDLEVRDGDGTLLWQLGKVNYQLGRSTRSLVTAARTLATTIDNCRPESDAATCNVVTGSRSEMTDSAKTLALAYQLSRDSSVSSAAMSYISRILTVPYTSGHEASMAARVGTLGVLYDWFYHDNTLPKDDIRRYITDTIKADIPVTDPNPNLDLIGMICGNALWSDTTFDCAPTPERPVDISRYYITGHNGSAMTGAALGLLAITESENDLHFPLLERIYRHWTDGILPARDYIANDGGHHTLFGYNLVAGQIVERLIMWRRALKPNDEYPNIMPTAFESTAFLPYLYGVRGDLLFPASGDMVNGSVSSAEVGYMSLTAAQRGNQAATAFYRTRVMPNRTKDAAQTIWDELYFPGISTQSADLSSLPLSARFQRGGNVLMRDTWGYADAALLDFKSSSFISENHQHLDQNSFSLFYRKPLLLDSGAYDAYGSSHWFNYYQRTIAHNTITVFDPEEEFTIGTTRFLSNDGGQSYGARAGYPTLDEIRSGPHVLGGITRYQEDPVHGDYAFVTGDATRAYSNAKMADNEGFLRSIFYLRAGALPLASATPPAEVKPVIVVFDRVRTKKNLVATSLLHSAERPEMAAAAVGGTVGTCRHKLRETPGNWPLTIRNGTGMVTVEPLLPRNAQIHLLGNSTTENGQTPQVSEAGLTTTNAYDCRFAVRDAAGRWVNYPHRDKFEHTDRGNIGAWRIEIAPRATDALSGKLQTFLNVLHVADNKGTGSPDQHVAKLLTQNSEHGAVAVSVHGTTIAFATSANATSLSWTHQGSTTDRILAAGLKRNAKFTMTKGSQTINITESVVGLYESSADGVVDTAQQP